MTLVISIAAILIILVMTELSIMRWQHYLDREKTRALFGQDRTEIPKLRDEGHR